MNHAIRVAGIEYFWRLLSPHDPDLLRNSGHAPLELKSPVVASGALSCHSACKMPPRDL